MLKPQDLLVALKLVALGRGTAWTYHSLAESLTLSLSETHNAVKRAQRCGLLSGPSFVPISKAIHEFLVHGVRYVFPAEIGRRTRGLLTGPHAPPLLNKLSVQEEQGLVWPYARGDSRASSLKPLHKGVPIASASDPKLYALLVLVDGLRLPSARVREMSAKLLHPLLFEREGKP